MLEATCHGTSCITFIFLAVYALPILPLLLEQFPRLTCVYGMNSRYPQSGNRLFCDEITKWAFHERGVLRVTNLRHNHAGSAEQPHWYRVSDDLELKMDIHELAGGTRQPYRYLPHTYSTLREVIILLVCTSLCTWQFIEVTGCGKG